MKETTASASGMLAREYPNWATELGPVPGRVVGLLLPAHSRWGRSLQWIGEGIVSHPDAYGFQPEQHRVYLLHAKGVSPRLLSFLVPAPGGGAMSEQAIPLGPGSNNPLGLGKEAHLVELEVNGGTGAARASTFTLTATGVRAVEGTPGYPRDVAELMDGARGAFDQFVQGRATEVARALKAVATQLPPVPGVAPQESAAEAIFPYWDEERRQLWVTFTRRVMRTTAYGVPCLFVYEGMPAEHRSMEIRQAYGVELGQTLALDARGMLVEVRHFEPAPLVLPSDDPDPPSAGDGKLRHLRICPGSPGAGPRADLPFRKDERLEEGPVPPPLPPPVCGNGKKETWAGPEPEACDGKDFGAQTCETLGFLGGTLECTARCALEVSGCDPGGSSAAHPSHTARTALEGDLSAVSVGHGKIAAVATRGPALVARFFQGPKLAPADGGKERRWDLPRAHGHSLGLPVMAPAEDGFLVAVPAYGNTSQIALLLHLSTDGRWSGPISTLQGRPVFLVRGAGQALLGLVTERLRVQIEVVRVEGTGKLAGEPVAAIEAAPMSTYAVASAAFTGDGWWVAAGNGNNPFVYPLKYARVGLDGRRVSAQVAPVGTGQLQVVRGPRSTFVVHVGPGGVAAIEIPDGGTGAALPPKVLSGDFFPRLVAARWEGDRLVAWASDVPGRLQRLSLDLRTGARSARTAVAIPTYIPLGADFAEGALVHIFQGAPHRDRHVERGLWLYRGE